MDTLSAAGTHDGHRVPSAKKVAAPPSSRSATTRPYGAKPARKAPRIPRSQMRTRADTQLPALSDVLTTHVPVLTHVPWTARHLVRDALTQILWDYGNATGTADEVDALHRLLIFAKCVLAAPTATRNVDRTGGAGLARLVNNRLAR
eukprot:IDg21549t1